MWLPRIAGNLLGLVLVLAAALFAMLGDCTLHPFMTYGEPSDAAKAEAWTQFGIGFVLLVLAVLVFRLAWRHRARPPAEPPAG
jgi:cytochrome b561